MKLWRSLLLSIVLLTVVCRSKAGRKLAHEEDHTHDHASGNTHDHTQEHSHDHAQEHSDDHTQEHSDDHTKTQGDIAKDTPEHTGENTHDHSHESTHDHAEEHSPEEKPRPIHGKTANEMIEKERKFFVRQIFNKYGHNGKIMFEGFEHLLESLGLADVKITDHDIHDHQLQGGFKNLHKTHKHDVNGTKKRPMNHWQDDLLADIYEAIRPSNVTKKKTDDLLSYIYEAIRPLNTTKLKKPADSTKPVNATKPSKLSRPDRHNRRRHQGKRKGKKHRAKPSRRLPRAIAQNPRDYTKKEPSQFLNYNRLMDEVCMTPSQLFMAYQLKYEDGLTEQEFLSVCPAMVYQLDMHVCNKMLRNKDCFHEKGTHLHEFHPSNKEGAHSHGKKPGGRRHGHGHSHGVTAERTWELWELPADIWGFAVLSITIISLVGLGGVAVVPIMRKVFYNHLIQFLVALAVGSLTGDALLHLLPHSILQVETGHDTSDLEAEAAEKNSVYRGLVALGGIYFFFIAERIMAILSEKKKQRKRKRRRSIREKVVGQKLSEYGEKSKSCEDIVMVLNPNKVEMQDALNVVIEDKRRSTAPSITLEVPNQLNNSTHVSEQSLKSHESHDSHDELEDGPVKKGHGHSHGGDGKPPQSIASVAWMVILGDGLHNFSDGLAIGAAFANSLTGGLSTSIAVFCHELPHELGDFAVLLKAGMTAKQALFYNLLSSVLSFVGMIIGVCVGNISSASFWIFAMTAGMFLYIALVDMLPEISTVETKPGESAVCHLLLHLAGISVGLGIMLVIALFEDSIKISMSDTVPHATTVSVTTMGP